MAQSKPQSILLVEDDPFIAMDAHDSIVDRGISCHVAYDCASAFRIVENEDIVGALLDFDLGRENSIDVAKKLQAAGRPFFFVTGRNRDEITKLMGGNTKTFLKPVNYGSIAEKLICNS